MKTISLLVVLAAVGCSTTLPTAPTAASLALDGSVTATCGDAGCTLSGSVVNLSDRCVEHVSGLIAIRASSGALYNQAVWMLPPEHILPPRAKALFTSHISQSSLPDVWTAAPVFYWRDTPC